MLSVISDRRNFAIVASIMENGPQSFAALQKELGLRKSELKSHISDLLSCSYLFPKKAGREYVYHLNRATVVPLLKLIHNHLTKYHK